MTVGHSGRVRAHASAAGQPAHRVRHAGRAAGAARRVAGPGAPAGPAPLPCSPALLYICCTLVGTVELACCFVELELRKRVGCHCRAS